MINEKEVQVLPWNSDLTPCPFCGRGDISLMDKGESVTQPLDVSLTPSPDEGPYYYECCSCGARGPYSNQRDRVRFYWNDRR